MERLIRIIFLGVILAFSGMTTTIIAADSSANRSSNAEPTSVYNKPMAYYHRGGFYYRGHYCRPVYRDVYYGDGYRHHRPHGYYGRHHHRHHGHHHGGHHHGHHHGGHHHGR